MAQAGRFDRFAAGAATLVAADSVPAAPGLPRLAGIAPGTTKPASAAWIETVCSVARFD